MPFLYTSRKLHITLMLLLAVGMVFPGNVTASGKKKSRTTHIEQPGDTWMTSTPPQQSRRKRSHRKTERVTGENTPAPHMIVVPKPEHHAALEQRIEPLPQKTQPCPAPKVEKKNPFLVFAEKLLFRRYVPLRPRRSR